MRSGKLEEMTLREISECHRNQVSVLHGGKRHFIKTVKAFGYEKDCVRAVFGLNYDVNVILRYNLTDDVRMGLGVQDE